MTGERYDRLAYGTTVLVDLAIIWVAALAAWFIRYELQWFRGVEPGFYQPFSAYVWLFAILSVVLMGVFHANRVYRQLRGVPWINEMVTISNGVVTGIVIVTALTFGVRPLAYSRLLFVYDGILLLLLFGIARLGRRWVSAALRARGFNVDRMLIVGAGEIGRAVMRTLVAQPELGYEVVGFVDDEPDRATTDVGRFKALGSIDRFDKLLKDEAIDEVIICLSWHEHDRIMSLVRTCLHNSVRPRIVPDIFQLSLNRVDIEALGSIPLLGIRSRDIPSSGRLAKRTVDIVLTVLGLALLSPLLILVAIVIRLDSPGPVLFRQTRLGQFGKPFQVFKFRSMHENAETLKADLQDRNEADGPLFKIKDDPRRTRVGRIIRRFSIDEFPQLLNVLRGDMSLVGPRPGLPEEVAQYKPWQRQRLQVKPGITGLAQISGRSDLSFDEMCLLDIYYIENWSLTLDMTMLFRSVPRVLTGQGAY